MMEGLRLRHLSLHPLKGEFMKTVEETYGSNQPVIPEGFGIIGYRNPMVGEYFLPKSRSCSEPEISRYPWKEAHGPRLILVPVTPPVPPPAKPPSLSEVYKNGYKFPEGFSCLGFRPVQKGDWWLDSGGFGPCLQTTDDQIGMHRLILETVSEEGIYPRKFPIPSGYERAGFRVPVSGETWLSSIDGLPMSSTLFPHRPSTARIILKKVPAHPSLYDVYGKPSHAIAIPYGYYVVGFRKWEPGDEYITNGNNNVASITPSGAYENYRLIVRPVCPAKEKIFRVVRVLEYVGTEEWINKTMGRNAVHADGLRMTGGSYQSPGRDPRIRELSRFQEEVKQ